MSLPGGSATVNRSSGSSSIPIERQRRLDDNQHKSPDLDYDQPSQKPPPTMQAYPPSTGPNEPTLQSMQLNSAPQARASTNYKRLFESAVSLA